MRVFISRYITGLSKWVRTKVHPFKDFNICLSSLQKFTNERIANPPQPASPKKETHIITEQAKNESTTPLKTVQISTEQMMNSPYFGQPLSSNSLVLSNHENLVSNQNHTPKNEKGWRSIRHENRTPVVPSEIDNSSTSYISPFHGKLNSARNSDKLPHLKTSFSFNDTGKAKQNSNDMHAEIKKSESKTKCKKEHNIDKKPTNPWSFGSETVEDFDSDIPTPKTIADVKNSAVYMSPSVNLQVKQQVSTHLVTSNLQNENVGLRAPTVTDCQSRPNKFDFKKKRVHPVDMEVDSLNKSNTPGTSFGKRETYKVAQVPPLLVKPANVKELKNPHNTSCVGNSTVSECRLKTPDVTSLSTPQRTKPFSTPQLKNVKSKFIYPGHRQLNQTMSCNTPSLNASMRKESTLIDPTDHVSHDLTDSQVLAGCNNVTKASEILHTKNSNEQRSDTSTTGKRENKSLASLKPTREPRSDMIRISDDSGDISKTRKLGDERVMLSTDAPNILSPELFPVSKIDNVEPTSDDDFLDFGKSPKSLKHSTPTKLNISKDSRRNRLSLSNKSKRSNKIDTQQEGDLLPSKKLTGLVKESSVLFDLVKEKLQNSTIDKSSVSKDDSILRDLDVDKSSINDSKIFDGKDSSHVSNVSICNVQRDSSLIRRRSKRTLSGKRKNVRSTSTDGAETLKERDQVENAELLDVFQESVKVIIGSKYYNILAIYVKFVKNTRLVTILELYLCLSKKSGQIDCKQCLTFVIIIVFHDGQKTHQSTIQM